MNRNTLLAVAIVVIGFAIIFAIDVAIEGSHKHWQPPTTAANDAWRQWKGGNQ